METNKIEEPEINISIREYEGWSINNIQNDLYFKPGIGYIVLVSDKEINELEAFGLLHLIKHKANIYEGLDLDIIVANGEYNKKLDEIFIGYYYTHISNINKASSYLLSHNKDLLINSEHIICIYYEAIPRYKKSAWWRFWNTRKCNISGKYDTN